VTARSAVIPAGPRESRRQGRQHAAPPRPRIADLLHTARTRLAAGTGDGTGANADDPHRDAEILLTHATGLTVAAQVANPGRRVPPAQAKAFMALVSRRATGEPVAHLTGRKEFWSLELTVSPAVLIPRPETELLVELALEFARRRGHDELRILELGSGSGAVALALATELPGSHITATDSSPAAIEIARTNYRRLRDTGAVQSTVEFRIGDWFNALPAGAKFDLIVSNPPYIAPDDPHLQRGDLRFEPRTALVATHAGLADLARIIAAAPTHLTPGGALLLEHAPAQAAAVREMLARQNFTAPKTHPDLAGHARVTGGAMPAPHAVGKPGVRPLSSPPQYVKRGLRW